MKLAPVLVFSCKQPLKKKKTKQNKTKRKNKKTKLSDHVRTKTLH